MRTEREDTLADVSRIAALAAMVALSACATPPITLTPRYRLGEVRVYRIEARTDTSIDAAGVRAREETTLVARSRIEVAEDRKSVV